MTDIKAGQALIKALNDTVRISIIEMLSCEELCACDLLEKLTISQSTLSHHMKVLQKSGLVLGRKDSTWMYYSLNLGKFEELKLFIDWLSHEKDNCICKPNTEVCDV